MNRKMTSNKHCEKSEQWLAAWGHKCRSGRDFPINFRGKKHRVSIWILQLALNEWDLWWLQTKSEVQKSEWTVSAVQSNVLAITIQLGGNAQTVDGLGWQKHWTPCSRPVPGRGTEGAPRPPKAPHDRAHMAASIPTPGVSSQEIGWDRPTHNWQIWLQFKKPRISSIDKLHTD